MSNISQRLDDMIIECETQIQKLQSDLQMLDSSLPSQRATFELEITRKLQSLESRISRMKEDARRLQPSQRDYFDGEIVSIERRYNEIQSELQKKTLANRNSPASRQNQQLLANRDKSQRVTDDLDEAIRRGNDIITTGNVTMTTLNEDRRKIENIDENLHKVHQQARDGQTRAKRMLRRVVCNACLAWIIAIMMLALLACVLVLKFKKII